MLSTVVKALYAFTHLILTTILRDRYYYYQHYFPMGKLRHRVVICPTCQTTELGFGFRSFVCRDQCLIIVPFCLSLSDFWIWGQGVEWEGAGTVIHWILTGCQHSAKDATYVISHYSPNHVLPAHSNFQGKLRCPPPDLSLLCQERRPLIWLRNMAELL